MHIYTVEDDVLSKVAVSVLEEEFGEDLDSFMSDMATTMYGNRGVGLSGNQVGCLKRIIVVDLSYALGDMYGSSYIKMVNPEVIEEGGIILRASEGCLSFPKLTTVVNRREKIKVHYFTPLGEELVQDFSEYIGRIILHEIDHLDGITLLSRSSRVKRSRYLRTVRGNVNGRR